MMCGAPTASQPATAETQAIADQVGGSGRGSGRGGGARRGPGTPAGRPPRPGSGASASGRRGGGDSAPRDPGKRGIGSDRGATPPAPEGPARPRRSCFSRTGVLPRPRGAGRVRPRALIGWGRWAVTGGSGVAAAAGAAADGPPGGQRPGPPPARPSLGEHPGRPRFPRRCVPAPMRSARQSCPGPPPPAVPGRLLPDLGSSSPWARVSEPPFYRQGLGLASQGAARHLLPLPAAQGSPAGRREGDSFLSPWALLWVSLTTPPPASFVSCLQSPFPADRHGTCRKKGAPGDIEMQVGAAVGTSSGGREQKSGRTVTGLLPTGPSSPVLPESGLLSVPPARAPP